MAKDPYKQNILKVSSCHEKNPVIGIIIVVLKEYLEKRELELIHPNSRVVKKHEAHEAIITNENVGPGDIVNNVAYLCFTEFLHTGVIHRGDEVRVNGLKIGEICGFDETHMPNHINIVIKGDKFYCGKNMGLQLNSFMEIINPTAQP